MKKYFKEKFYLIALWAFKKARELFKSRIDNLIHVWYFEIAKKNLKVDTKVISVKKGKIKYDLLIYITPEEEYKIWLCRHDEIEFPQEFNLGEVSKPTV